MIACSSLVPILRTLTFFFDLVVCDLFVCGCVCVFFLVVVSKQFFICFLNLGFFCASFSFLSSTYYSPSIGIIIHGCVTLSVCVCVCVERFASTLSTWVSPWESQQHACMHPLHCTDQVKRLQKQTSLEPVKTLILLVENTFHLGLFHNSNIIFRNVELFKKNILSGKKKFWRKIMNLMKYWRIYHFVKMKSSILINYSTNMCQSGQGPMIQITNLRKVIVGIIGGGRRGWDPCVCVAFPL